MRHSGPLSASRPSARTDRGRVKTLASDDKGPKGGLWLNIARVSALCRFLEFCYVASVRKGSTLVIHRVHPDTTDDPERISVAIPRAYARGLAESSKSPHIPATTSASFCEDWLGGIAPWQSPRCIRPVSTTTRLPLSITQRRIIITRPPIIMIWAKTKRRRSTPTQLSNIASKDTSTPRPPANTLINNDERGRRRCRLLFHVLTDRLGSMDVGGYT
jgi:hypothetical protein